MTSNLARLRAQTLRISSKLVAVGALFFVLCSSLDVAAQVIAIRDGFGDGDINNNGTAYESVDVMPDYFPFLDEDLMVQNDSPRIFPSDPEVIGPDENDSVRDPSDTGIRWLTTGGFGSTFAGSPSAAPRIINDSAGYLPETTGNVGFFNAISGTTQNIPALDSGYALGAEVRGRGRSFAGFFESDANYGNGKQDTIVLGQQVGDEVTVSFDFRVWISSANYNAGNATNHVPDVGQLRFGLFEDEDNELGQTNDFAGPATVANDLSTLTPAVWGLEPGLFRGDFIGPDATNDPGWYARIPLQDDASIEDTLTNGRISPDGLDARINEELNNVSASERHLQGNDNQTVALPDDEAEVPEFLNLSVDNRYNIKLTLTRFDETNGSTDPADAGDNIMATLTVRDLDSGVEHSFGGFDSLEEPITSAGFASEQWDYVAFQLAGQSDSDEFDFLIDNFEITVAGSNEGDYASPVDADGDGDVDGTDFLLIQRTTPSLIPDWQAAYGGGASSAIAAVPEPTSLALIGLSAVLFCGGRRRK